jgi:hypothetical protein
MKTLILSLSAPILIASTVLEACSGDAAESASPERSAVTTCESPGGTSAAGGASGALNASGGSSAALNAGGTLSIAGAGASGASNNSAGGQAGAPFVPGPPYVAPAHTGNLVHVKNGCSFPLWLHGVGGGAVLMPDDLELNAGDMHDYTVGDWPFAWVTAFVDGPQKTLIDRAELTMFPAGLVSYRLAYIDGIGLPMELVAIGSGSDCKRVGCYATEAQILSECPDGLLSGKRCLSAGNYCNDPTNAGKSYCHALDASIARCAGNVSGCQDAAGATTANAYSCDKAFGDDPNLCAAVNRGMLSDPTSSDTTAFYRSEPHNSYAAWLHGICPGLNAFPYDDAHTTEDAFHACQSSDNSTQLDITFCPAG